MRKIIFCIISLWLFGFVGFNDFKNPLINSSAPPDQILFPTTDSTTYDQWTASSGSDKYAMVDDNPHDSATTYIYITDVNGRQYFTNNPVLPSGTILGVSVYYVDYEFAGATGGRPAIIVNGTEYLGDFFLSDPAWTEHSYEWTTNPDTGIAWTQEDVQGSGANPLEEWGVRATAQGAGDTMRVTQVYLLVRYN